MYKIVLTCKRRKKSFDHDVYSLSTNPLAQSRGTNKMGFGQVKIMKDFV
jgi:REP element-mobilizing transposase RayT